MHGQSNPPPPPASGREAFINDLARVSDERAAELAAKPPRGLGYHLRWIVINIILVAAGAYAATHYLKARALGPDAAVEQPAQTATSAKPPRG